MPVLAAAGRDQISAPPARKERQRPNLVPDADSFRMFVQNSIISRVDGSTTSDCLLAS